MRDRLNRRGSCAAPRSNDALLGRGPLATVVALAGALLAASGCSGSIGGSDNDGSGGGSTTATTSGEGVTTGSQSGSSQASVGSGGGGSTTTTTTTSGNGGGSPASTSATTGGGGNPYEQAAQLCVDTINMHRASIGLPPYARWTEAEQCSGDQCVKDSQSNTPHGAFGQCGEWAQNECPGWPGSPDTMIEGCLQMMWDEGPGADFAKHGHYINMSSQQYTRVACGFYVTPDGSVWSTQNFQ